MDRLNAAIQAPPADDAIMTEAALERHLIHLLRRFGLLAGLTLVRPVGDGAAPDQTARAGGLAAGHGRYRDAPGKDLAEIRRPEWGATA